MTKALLVLNTRELRERAISWIVSAPEGTRVTFRRPVRTLNQNDKLHAAITDVAAQVEWNGRKRDVEAWKDIFTAALRTAQHGLEVVPGINGGFVLLGMHTSQMSKSEVSDLIDLIHAFGAEHGVKFQDDEITPRDADRANNPAAVGA